MTRCNKRPCSMTACTATVRRATAFMAQSSPTTSRQLDLRRRPDGAVVYFRCGLVVAHLALAAVLRHEQLGGIRWHGGQSQLRHQRPPHHPPLRSHIGFATRTDQPVRRAPIRRGGRVSLYYDGEFYDNINMNLRAIPPPVTTRNPTASISTRNTLSAIPIPPRGLPRPRSKRIIRTRATCAKA